MKDRTQEILNEVRTMELGDRVNRIQRLTFEELVEIHRDLRDGLTQKIINNEVIPLEYLDLFYSVGSMRDRNGTPIREMRFPDNREENV